MATGDNAILPLFDPGFKVTGAASAAIGAGRFVKVSGNMQQVSPLLDVSTPTGPLVGGNLIVVAQCVAGDRAFGVAAYDASASGEVLPIYTSGLIVPMVAGAAITAGAEVQADANGAAITLAAGKSNGIAVNTAVGNVVYVAIR